MNLFYFSRIHHEFTTYFANLLWIHYLFRESTIVSQCFWRFDYDSLSFSRIPFKFTIFVPNSFWFQCLFRRLTMNSLFFSWICYEFTIFSRISFEFTLISLYFSRSQFWTMSFIKGWLMGWIDEIARQPLRIFKFKVLMT